MMAKNPKNCKNASRTTNGEQVWYECPHFEQQPPPLLIEWDFLHESYHQCRTCTFFIPKKVR